MKIATYNLWNSEAGMPQRAEQITHELHGLNADVICLQEAGRQDVQTQLQQIFRQHFACRCDAEELMVLTRYPVLKTMTYDYALGVKLAVGGYTVAVVNVHLPWDSALARENAIVKIMGGVALEKADYTLVMGDFNCSAQSAVQRFLLGEQSLQGADAYCFDLAEAYAQLSGAQPASTLNFRDNPRWGLWQEKNTLECNQRVDRILLKNPYPMKMPQLKACGIFGTAVSSATGLAASDHYGVCAEIEFEGDEQHGCHVAKTV